jgi:hypothetical protein
MFAKQATGNALDWKNSPANSGDEDKAIIDETEEIDHAGF